MPGYSKGALIAEVGDVRLGIGPSRSFSSPASGGLRLRMNDDILSDNAGSLTVRITVTPS